MQKMQKCKTIQNYNYNANRAKYYPLYLFYYIKNIIPNKSLMSRWFNIIFHCNALLDL